MNNPIPNSKLWVTPKDEQDLYRRLDNIGDSHEKQIAWNAAMIALNLAHKLVEEQKEIA